LLLRRRRRRQLFSLRLLWHQLLLALVRVLAPSPFPAKRQPLLSPPLQLHWHSLPLPPPLPPPPPNHLLVLALLRLLLLLLLLLAAVVRLLFLPFL
jgi:hypothetical protein